MNKTVAVGAVIAAIAVAAVALLVAVPARKPGAVEIRVLTDRTESHVAPIFAAYEKLAHVTIRAVYLDKGLISRLESRPNEADVVITKDADLLEIAKDKGLLQPMVSTQIQQVVPTQFRELSGAYLTDSYRARVIYYSKDRVKPAELSTYESLAGPYWKGRVCIRSGYHDYNLSLFGQMMVVLGPERTRRFLEGFSANQARTPTGDDRAQVRAIFEGKCDVAIANSYYMGIMLSSQEQRAWGESARIFFPNQVEGGTYILRSGLALTRSATNASAATALLEYMVSEPAQLQIVNSTFAYPVRAGVPLPEINQKLGEGQPWVAHGVFKIRPIALADVVAQREAVIRMLDEIQFDKPR
jgi:iron(III) transport system substrate-binding protein